VILEKCPGCGVVKIVQGYQLVTKLNLNAKRVHHWVTFPIESNPTSPTTETVKFVVVSSGKPVKIDGVAFFRTA
jgi:hypothetical protein